MLVLVCWLGFCQSALAESAGMEWHVTSLSGQMEWKAESETVWLSVQAGERIPTPAHVRTAKDSRATLTNGADTLKISPNSLLFFPAPEHRDGNPFVRILQKIGVVSYDVETRKQPGFQVEASYLTSLVKGTLFEVAAGVDQSTVTLLNGRLLVARPDGTERALLQPLQTATASKEQPQIRIISLRRGNPQSLPKRISTLSSDEAERDSADPEGFSWAQDLGLFTVTQDVSTTTDNGTTTNNLGQALLPAGNNASVLGIDTGLQLPTENDIQNALSIDLSDTTASITESVPALDTLNGLSVPTDLDTSLSVTGDIGISTGGLGLSGITSDNPVTSTAPLDTGTLTLPGGILDTPTLPSESLPVLPPPADLVPDIGGSLGL